MKPLTQADGKTKEFLLSRGTLFMLDSGSSDRILLISRLVLQSSSAEIERGEALKEETT